MWSKSALPSEIKVMRHFLEPFVGAHPTFYHAMLGDNS